MALTASPFGFLLRKHPDGQSRANAYTIASGYAADIGYGDAVTLDTTGVLVIGVPTADLIGVFAGVQYTDASGKPTFSKRWPANTVATEIVAWVYDDPENVYEVQVEAGGTGYLQAAIGAQADLVPGVPNALTGHSTMALEATIEAAGAQGQFRIIAFDDNGFYNATTNPFPQVLVEIAQHQYVANKVAI